MQQFYRLDLAGAVYGQHPISVRRLRTLIGGLPRESRTIQAVSDQANWTETVELQAQTVDMLGRLYHLTLAANSSEPPTWQPPRVTRPESVTLELDRIQAADRAAEQASMPTTSLAGLASLLNESG